MVHEQQTSRLCRAGALLIGVLGWVGCMQDRPAPPPFSDTADTSVMWQDTGGAPEDTTPAPDMFTAPDTAPADTAPTPDTLGPEDSGAPPEDTTVADSATDTGGAEDTAPQMDTTPPEDTTSPVDTEPVEDTAVADTGPTLDTVPADVPPACEGPTCAGTPSPEWALVDFQTKSSKYTETYGLEAFKGKVTLLALLAGW